MSTFQNLNQHHIYIDTQNAFYPCQRGCNLRRSDAIKSPLWLCSGNRV